MTPEARLDEALAWLAEALQAEQAVVVAQWAEPDRAVFLRAAARLGRYFSDGATWRVDRPPGVVVDDARRARAARVPVRAVLSATVHDVPGLGPVVRAVLGTGHPGAPDAPSFAWLIRETDEGWRAAATYSLHDACGGAGCAGCGGRGWRPRSGLDPATLGPALATWRPDERRDPGAG